MCQSQRSTDAQRYRILRLYKRLEWDTHTVTAFHKLADVRAESFVGRSVDAYLDHLLISEASTLIERLEHMC